MNPYPGNSTAVSIMHPVGGCAVPMPPSSEAPITNACRRLECSMDRLAKTVETLSVRLQPVLAPPMPVACNAMTPSPSAPDTPLSETIKNRALAIENSTETLNDILRRLGLE